MAALRDTSQMFQPATSKNVVAFQLWRFEHNTSASDFLFFLTENGWFFRCGAIAAISLSLPSLDKRLLCHAQKMIKKERPPPITTSTFQWHILPSSPFTYCQKAACELYICTSRTVHRMHRSAMSHGQIKNCLAHAYILLKQLGFLTANFGFECLKIADIIRE